MGADDSEATVEALYQHLAATQERPVERTASHWIAEAEAVAGDLVGDDDVSDSVLADRLGHVAALLENIDDTEDEVANRCVAAARRLTAELLADLDAA